ncbi:MAG: trypsin-like peptidase domain-containing protein [Burkholderiales bacterium]|nr:trypsin-like peptidase domain-containing protein [Burkholderiales bacterium]
MNRRWLLGLLGAGAGSLAWAGLEQTIDAAKPSLVAVGTYDPLASPRFQFRGTGFVIGDGRRVVTCAHVLAKLPGSDAAPQWMLVVPKGRQPPELRPAKVLGTDAEHDLAVMAIEGEPLPALRLAASGVAREGRDVAVFGFPLGSVLGLAAARSSAWSTWCAPRARVNRRSASRPGSPMPSRWNCWRHCSIHPRTPAPHRAPTEKLCRMRR